MWQERDTVKCLPSASKSMGDKMVAAAEADRHDNTWFQKKTGQMRSVEVN